MITKGQFEGEFVITNPGVEDFRVTSRNWAGNILHEVADYGSVGMFPKDISAFDLGRALSRIAMNSHEQGNLIAEIKRGWDRVQEELSQGGE